ncbi:hypothetical protein BC361_25495 [Ensifer sp. LC54]|nr:hypothetical protein BC361_25495 [Ensifer sp. LC54]OCP23294.1 hypothetical protein BC363_25270 [Ensifer sp. LC384]
MFGFKEGIHLFFRFVRHVVAFLLRLVVFLLCVGAAAVIAAGFFSIGIPLLLLVALAFGLSTLGSRIDPRRRI